MAAEL